MTLAETQQAFWRVLRGEAPDGSFVRGPNRLDVYANMFLVRQLDALRADFPQFAERPEFEEVATKYILAHPSDDPDLGRLGRHFARFTGDPLVALEWARCEVFLEAEVARLSEFRPDFRVAPALRIAGRTVVWRAPASFTLHEVELDDDELHALQAALAGASFEEICGAFGEPARAFEALQSWLAEGWLIAR